VSVLKDPSCVLPLLRGEETDTLSVSLRELDSPKGTTMLQIKFARRLEMRLLAYEFVTPNGGSAYWLTLWRDRDEDKKLW
jgi:hypothetical protein